MKKKVTRRPRDKVSRERNQSKWWAATTTSVKIASPLPYNKLQQLERENVSPSPVAWPDRAEEIDIARDARSVTFLPSFTRSLASFLLPFVTPPPLQIAHFSLFTRFQIGRSHPRLSTSWYAFCNITNATVIFIFILPVFSIQGNIFVLERRLKTAHEAFKKAIQFGKVD